MAHPSPNFRVARMAVAIFAALTMSVLLVIGIVSAAQTDARAPEGHPSGPTLQLPLCEQEDGTGDVKPCMWHGPDSPDGGLTVINFPDGSWCYPTEITRGVWTNCVPEK